jgi:hypothetical protein
MDSDASINPPPATAAAPEGPATTHPAAAPTPRRLTDDLQTVLAHANGQSIRVRELVDVLQERGLAFVLMFTTLPFLLPVPTMGLSAPAGAAVALYGICVMFNLKPWLPGFIANRELSYPTLEKIVGFGVRTGRKVERLLRPRMKFMMWPGVNALLGISLILSGFYLALPIPLPFANAIPAAAILLILAGLIERDGVFVLAGQLICLAMTLLFAYVIYLVVKFGWAGAKAMLGIGEEPAAAPAGAPAATTPAAATQPAH